MTTKAYSSQGLAVYIGTFDAQSVDAAADVFVEIGEVIDIDPPAPQADTIDVTHFKSTKKEFIQGLIDAGAGRIVCNLINDDPGQLECQEAMDEGSTRNFRIDFPTTLNPNRIDFKAIVVGETPKPGRNDRPINTFDLKTTTYREWSNQ